MGDRSYSRVVWSEGMHLAQHHFQAQARYFERSSTFAVSRLFLEPYGFLDLTLDREALKGGSVGILQGQGVMPDGLAFSFPGEDSPPPLRDAHGMGDPGREAVRVSLAIPAYRGDLSNCQVDLSRSDALDPGYRFRAREVQVKDENSGSDSRKVLLAQKNFRILFDSELSEDVVAMPMGSIGRDSAGHLQFEPDFIPPVLDFRASPRLVQILDGLLEVLTSKADTLGQRRAAVRHELADLSYEEVTSYWMAHGVHSGLAGLRHVRDLPRCHPEELYREMIRLTGALSTFSMDEDPGDLPSYDHKDLTRCFGELDRRLRGLLSVMVPEGFVGFPLDRVSHNILAASLEDQRAFRRGSWVLRVASKGSDADVLRNVPGLAKVCSREDIQRLVDDANPGLPMEHLPSLPSSIPRRMGSFYFGLKQEGPCWQLIEARSSLGVYVPDLLSDAEMELIVVKD